MLCSEIEHFVAVIVDIAAVFAHYLRKNIVYEVDDLR